MEPRLAHHGFKFDEQISRPPTSSFFFKRTYWCKTQYIAIARVEYTLEEVTELAEEGSDIPVEVPPELMVIKEPGYRLWLSNRYLEAVINGRQIVRGESLSERGPMAVPEGGVKKPYPWWWEFRNAEELRQVVHEIMEMILSEGLDYLEEEVADIRRYDEKLVERRRAEKERRERRKLTTS